ncbi:MAG: hypothetical protein IT180_08325 [Acidobacteria bacterium]|nr:hypothetical protein [Acidobacteriota bacterium]
MKGRSGLIGSFAIALAVPLLAQTIPPASIADQELGWAKIYNFKGATAPLKVDHRVYSAAQRTIAMELANWMQASYSPIGGLGDLAVVMAEKLTPYNQNTTARAQSYGVAARVYTELKYGANKKLEPFTSSHFTWNVIVNGPFGEEAAALSTPERYYFTIPTFEQQGFGPELEKAADVSNHPFLGQFPAWFQRNSVNGNRKYVLIAKDRRLPFVKLTRGEYLDALGVAITRKYELEKKRITEAEQGDAQRIARSMTYIEEATAKRRAALEANRVKYAGRLQEVAEIARSEPDIMLENAPDAFLGNGGSSMRLPVYTVDAATLERCKGDTPQWIVVSWTAQLNQPASKHLHDAVLNQFNFEYLYNRFFDPAKVAGQPYAPLRPAGAPTTASEPSAAMPSAAMPSAASRAGAADPAVHFFDDFSATPVGKAPLKWRSNLDNTGKTSVVTELKGLDGHWASLSGFTITPTALKGPLPRDVTISFDLVAARDYTWGARGMIFKMSKGVANSGKDAFFTVKLRPGFGGRDGEAEIEGKFPGEPGYFNETKWLKVPGFSNTEQNNRITVTVTRAGEMVRVSIGKAKIAEYPKAIPATVLFDAIAFDLQRQAGPNDQMYVSNIRISKR